MRSGLKLKRLSRFIASLMIPLIALPPGGLAVARATPTYQDLSDLMVSASVRTEPDFSEKTKAFLDKLEKSRNKLVDKSDGLISLVGSRQKEAAKDAAKKKDLIAGNSRSVLDAYAEAKANSVALSELLKDPAIPPVERFSAFAEFLRSQLLPLRELTTLLGKDAPPFADRKYFNSLIPRIPSAMLESDPTFNRERSDQILSAMGFQAANVCMPEGSGGEIEIRIDPTVLLLADAGASAAAPTPDNYVRSLKLTTMAMILGQLTIHQQMTGDGTEIAIPKACRERLNGDLPDSISVPPLSDDDREARYESLMVSNGLSSLSPEYETAFVSQDLGSPGSLQKFLGYTPFEKHQAATSAGRIAEERMRLAMSGSGLPLPAEPAIEDSDAYEHVIGIRAGAAVQAIQGAHLKSETYTVHERRVDVRKTRLVPDSSAAQADLMSFLQLEEDKDIRVLGLAPKSLLARLDQKKAALWEDVVPESLKKRLQDTQVQLDWPPATSPAGYRTWAMGELAASLQEKIQPKMAQFKGKRFDEVDQLFGKLYGSDYKKYLELRDFLIRVGDACGINRDRAVYHRFECRDGRPVWDFIDDLTSKVAKYRLHERSDGDGMGPLSREEREFFDGPLKDTWQALSSIGQIEASKISEWDLLNSQLGSNPFSGIRLAIQLDIEDAKVSQDKRRVKALENTLKALGLDEPARPFLANRALDSSEKDTFWNAVKASHDQKNDSLFRAPSGGIDSRRDYYSVLTELAATRLIDSGSASSAASSVLRGSPAAAETYRTHAGDVLQSELGKKAALLQQIYQAKNNPDEQDRLMEKFSETFPEDSDADGFNPKEARQTLLDLDTALKTPLYKEVIKKASRAKQAELKKALEKLCNLQPDDHENFKLLVLSTMRAQDQLNQQLGLKALPSEVQEELDRMTDKDWKDLKLGLLSAGLFIGGTLLLTLATGGLAAIPALATAATVTSGAMIAGGVGIGAVYMPKQWLDELPNAEDRLRFARTFEALNLTNQESIDRLQGEIETMKTWGVGMNVAFSLSMIKPAAVSLQATARATSAFVRAAKPGLDSSARKTLVELAKRGQKDAELVTAEYLFGYRKITADLLAPGKLAARVLEESAKPVSLAVQNADQVVKDSAEVYAHVFKNDSKTFTSFLTSLRRRLVRKGAKDTWDDTNVPGLNWLLDQRRRGIARGKDLVSKIDTLLEAAKRDDLKTVLTKNNDMFSEIVTELPRRKRDWLATITIDGVPGMGTRMLNLKEAAQARKSLLEELGRKTAARNPVGSKAHELTAGVRGALLGQGPAGQKLWQDLGGAMSRSLQLPSIQALEALLGSGRELPADLSKKLLESAEVKKLAQDAEKSLRNYGNLDQFDQWLAAKKFARLMK